MAEKFRPRKISDVVGQDTVKNLIRRSLRNRTFPQFSLMYGPSGTGKSTMAEICGMALTCENMDNGEPCGSCKSCRDNLMQLDAGKKTMNLVKINMGAIERSDFKQTIKEVFTLQPALGDNAVYIFEEIQALTKDEQNILLEYISNIQKNIFVIACTTEMSRLRQELRNRAIKFQFKQLKTDEALTLLNTICKTKGIKSPPNDIAKFMLRSSNNCPREIVNMIDFLADSDSLNSESLTEFLGFIPNNTYIEYFKKCSEDTYEFVSWLDTITEKGFENVVKNIRNFIISCYAYIYGSNTQYFNTQEKHQLKEIFSNVSEDKILTIMKYFDECRFDDDTSAKYCLIMGRRLFNEQTVKSVIKESKREASKAVINSEHNSKVIEKNRVKHDTVNENSLDELLGSFKKINKPVKAKEDEIPLPKSTIKVPVVEAEISEDLTKVSEEYEDTVGEFKELELNVLDSTGFSSEDLTINYNPDDFKLGID